MSCSTATRPVGEAGGGAGLVFGVVAPAFLVGLAAVNVGIAQAALSVALEHAKSRALSGSQCAGGGRDGSHALANMDIDVRAARALLQEAARLGDGGDEEALVELMEAKVFMHRYGGAGDTGCAGGMRPAGLFARAPDRRHLRDARAGAVMAPTNGVLRTWSAKAIAGLPVP